MGVLFIKLGRFSKAQACHMHVLDSTSANENSITHPTAMRHLSGVLQELGDYAQAETILERSHKRQSQIHNGTLASFATMHSYASVCKSLGRLDDAKTFYVQALIGHEAKLGPRSLLVIEIIDALDELYCSMGRFPEAVSHNRRAYSIRKEILGESHRDVFVSASHLSMALAGCVCQDSTNSSLLVEAVHLAESALQGCKSLLGSKHPTTIQMVWRRATLLGQQLFRNEATEMLESAHSDLERALGDKHPECQALLMDLKG
jgi:tetratricopeptide (TPR) repeat protein